LLYLHIKIYKPMKIRNILFVIFTAVSIQAFSQLVTWSLTTDSLPTINDNRINASPFYGGIGIGNITYGTSGAYANGWTTDSTIDQNDYFGINISPDSGYTTTIDSIVFSFRRSLSGPRKIAIYYSLHSDFSNPVFVDSLQINDDSNEHFYSASLGGVQITHNDTLVIHIFAYASESNNGTFRINDNTLSIFGNIEVQNINDHTSSVIPSSPPLGAVTVSSTDISANNAVPVLKFVIVDNGSSDSKPTYLKTLKFYNAHPANEINWTDAIGGIVLLDNNTQIVTSNISITDDYITVSLDSGIVTVNDGTVKELTLAIYLQPHIADGKHIQIKIDSVAHGFTAYPSGSDFATTFPAPIYSGIITIDVQATAMSMYGYPNVVWSGTPFPLYIKATDNNGNIDNDFTGNVSLSLLQGNGTLSPTQPQTTFNNGIATFSNLVYNGTGNFVLKAEESSATLQPTVSEEITSAIAYDSIYETFSDGDLVNNYLWLGDINAFSITTDTSKELVLFTYTSSADTSYISLPYHNTHDSIEWSLKVKMDLAPSSNNYVKYFLIANNYDLTQPTGISYYIQMGESGTNDAITLIKRDSLGNEHQICRTQDGDIADEPLVRLRIVFNPNTHKWSIYTDFTGAENYELSASGTDTLPSLQDSRFFTGILLRYSSTNDENKFFFDDFYVGKVRVDTIPPTIESVVAEDSTTLTIHFSEGVKGNTVADINNYQIDNGIGMPALAYRDTFDFSIVHLILPFALTSGQTYTLTVAQIKDFWNNSATNLQSTFKYYLPQLNDITINEIMADPSPAVELPEYEYLELYNTSSYELSLKNWTLKIGTKDYTFDNTVLPADSFLIVSTQNGCNALSQYGHCAPIITSSTALTNSGQTVTLFDKFHRVISSVSYSDDWYGNSAKKEGGWSLEKIDPYNACQGGKNWTASTDKKGGTPGAKNSVFAHNPDEEAPYIIGLGLPTNDTIIVYFSEAMDSASISNPSNYNINYGIGSPSQIILTAPNYNTATLVLSQPVSGGVTYTLSFGTNIKDCSGNQLSTAEKNFSMPIEAMSNDVVINEILYNPLDGCVDYVEIYNASSHSIDLSSLRIANKDNEDTSQFTNIEPLTEKSFLMMPKTFWVITSNPDIVKHCYYAKNQGNFITLKNMPSLPSNNGNVAIINKWLSTIDYLEYNDKMQFYLLSSTKGVALERINYYQPTNDKNNWHSAAETCGYGTPTYQNSQYIENPESANSEITLSGDIFSPDNDGENDILQINYNFDKPGYTCTVIIFDAGGRPVKTLAKKESVATSGTFIWDGTNQYNIKTPSGIYIVYVEAIDKDGNVKTYKNNVVVAYKN